MALILHILIALASVIFTTYLFASPSKDKFKHAYGLVALTIVSGCYLVWSKPAVMVQACTTGLVYVVIILAALAGAHNRLAGVKDRLND